MFLLLFTSVSSIIKRKKYHTKLGGIIQSLHISRFWHRRICEAAGVLGAIIGLLYVWTTYLSSNSNLAVTLGISSFTASLALITVIAAVILYFWSPRKYLYIFSASLYALLVVTTGTLVIQSDGVHSPFIALWMAVSVFAGLYGIYGLAAVLALVNVYLVYIFVTNGISREDIIVAAIAGELPMFISYILWNGRESLEVARDHDVSKLNKTIEQETTKADAIIEAIGDGVIVVSQTGEILVINPAAQQMTGWSTNDATHLHVDSVLKLQNDKGEALVDTTNPIARVLNVGQQVREKEICIITKSGKKIYAAFVVSPMGTGDGAIAVFRDITKERDEEHAQAEFISTASHEMRTPVASIEGYLGLALNPSTATIDEKARDFIEKAHASAQHLGALFQDLLDVSKADDGRLKGTPRVIEAVEFTRDIIEGLRPKAVEKNLELTFKPDGSKSTAGTMVIAPVLYSHVDKDHLREVLDNLIENAIKYTPDGSVTIDVDATDDYVRVAITDSGLGIPAEDIPHLFQKFYRVDSSDTREIGGTGLGLYLCRKLVESMEGRIWVESEFKKGSTFYVEIPRIDRSKATELVEREKISARTTQSAPVDSTPAVPVLDSLSNHHESVAPTPIQAPEVSPASTPAPQTPAPAPVTQAPVPISVPADTIAPAPAQPGPVAINQAEAPRFGAVTYNPAQPPETSAPTPEFIETPLAKAVPQRANIPLAALERDPSQYVSRRPDQS